MRDKIYHMIIDQEAGATPAYEFWNTSLDLDTVKTALFNLRKRKCLPKGQCVALLKGSLECLELVSLTSEIPPLDISLKL